MKPFHEAGNSEQFRRLRPLAERALAAYELGPARLSPVQQVSNAVYRVEAADGRRYALRVHNARWSDPRDIESELQWLEHVRRSGTIAVPKSVATRTGEWVQSVDAPGLPTPRLCTILTWVPGSRLGKRVTFGRIRCIGALMARLHTLSAQFVAPSGFRRSRLYAAGLMGRTPMLSPAWHALTPEQRTLFEQVEARLDQATAQLGDGPRVFGMLHGDFTLGNVLVGPGGRLALIDFDDCAWGYFAYELAVLLDWLEARSDYLPLRAALLEGYREVRALSEAEETHLDLFLLVRWVFLGLSFLSRPDHARFREYAPRFFRVVTPKLAAYLG
jgi:Ser/Thr protein kinase RdoA (MazF antagonist)